MSRPGKQYGNPLPDGWLTVEEAAWHIGVTPAAICGIIKDWPDEIIAKRYVDPSGKLTKFWIVNAWSLDGYALEHGRPRKPKPKPVPVQGRVSSSPEGLTPLPNSDVWLTLAAASQVVGRVAAEVHRMRKAGRFALTLCVKGRWYIARSSAEQVKHEELVGLRRRLEQG